MEVRLGAVGALEGNPVPGTGGCNGTVEILSPRKSTMCEGSVFVTLLTGCDGVSWACNSQFETGC